MTEIKYKSQTIAIEAGKTATLHTSGQKLTEDISIAFDTAGSFSYKGNTVEVEAGKTANLLCAGKKFATDVVVAVEDALARTLVTSDGYYLVASDGTILMVRE